MDNYDYEYVCAENDQLQTKLAECLKVLTACEQAIGQAPIEAFGFAKTDGGRAVYPIKDELLHNVRTAIAKATDELVD